MAPAARPHLQANFFDSPEQHPRVHLPVIPRPFPTLPRGHQTRPRGNHGVHEFPAQQRQCREARAGRREAEGPDGGRYQADAGGDRAGVLRGDHDGGCHGYLGDGG
jgi:hypothetical protein